MASKIKLLLTIFIMLQISKPSTADLGSRVIFGTEARKMYSCLIDKPDSCDVVFTGDKNPMPIRSLAVSGEILYAGFENGEMWLCYVDSPHYCTVFNQAATPINAIAVTSDYIFAGLGGGTLWRCPLEKPHYCYTFYYNGNIIKSVAADGNILALGLDNGQLLNCNLDKQDACWVLNKADGKVNAVGVFKHQIFVGLGSGVMWRCDYNVTNSCIDFNKADSGILSMDIRGDYIYAGLDSGELWQCSLDTPNSCSVLAKFNDKMNCLATTYKSTELNNFFIGEDKYCTWQDRSKCIPPVMYYNIEQRIPFELIVKNGKLYDYLGDLFDTTDADISHSGNKAIFVMEPRGRIYASVKHPMYLVHHSSFLGGNIVSAAGELEVEQGVIKTITTCAAHYISSMALNEQVITSLRRKGYEGKLTLTDCKKCKLVLDSHFNRIE